MLPSSHEVHIEAQRPPAHGALLAEAFSDFISASARLELSYRDLQAEVAELSMALCDRNQALTESLSVNRTMGDTLQRILEAIPCGVLVVDGEGSVRLANPEAVRLLALSTAQMPTLDSIQTKIGLHLELHAMEEGTEDEQELSFERPDGRHWIAVRRVHLPGLEASLGASKAEAVLTLRDISVRKRMEQEREAARDAVALSQVSALLAHEIRNPLASLELFAGLLTDNPECGEEWLSHLRAGIRSLSGTVNNVLTLNGNVSLTTERVDVAHEAAMAVRFLQPLAKQAKVALELGERSEPMWFIGNKNAFHQILLNVCSNALRHTPAKGKVRVACTAPGDASEPIRISVTDTGCGIPPQNLTRVFEVGFSGSGTTSGLGLAVCERLINQQGGLIQVQSRVGHGSTFTLELPQA